MRNVKILVVDDEVIITLQLEERLKRMGYEVVGRASSGEAAVELATRVTPDLVLMDIVMPGQHDGIAAAHTIITELDIPVLFLTAYTDDIFLDRAKTVEPHGYIVKPFHDREIKAAIDLALYRKDVERRLRKSEEEHRFVVDNISDAIITADSQGGVIGWNRAAGTVFGYEASEVVAQPITVILSESLRAAWQKEIDAIISNGGSEHLSITVESTGRAKAGREFPLELCLTTWGTRDGTFLTVVARDITGRKRMDKTRQLLLDVLEILNPGKDRYNAIEAILRLVKDYTGLDAVGIRLREGDGCPYYATNGFPDHFIKAEQDLRSRDPVGKVLRDANGSPTLECMCGNVLSGRIDPTLPYFTGRGSFWTNSTAQLPTKEP